VPPTEAGNGVGNLSDMRYAMPPTKIELLLIVLGIC
jgi:hypothetical protein